MYKRKMIALFLTLVLIVSLAVSAYAASSYCDVLVGEDMCGKVLKWSYKCSVDYAASHTYRVVTLRTSTLKTCNYTYFYCYGTLSCAAGHVAESTKEKVDYGHSCGKDLV